MSCQKVPDEVDQENPANVRLGIRARERTSEVGDMAPQYRISEQVPLQSP